ncbi:hypothetical protein EVAR_21943_1 [Eumeta japonica]|uniref:Uncharacterized protein n=1 Tax=Eumeta variegata TaxID=151549 RepID=A0A4C1VU67_EUMVA|nr:hypothetical protein EVAR_21943_1 [Eumeta japonica]
MLLSHIAKLCKRIMLRRLYRHLTPRHEQLGFASGHSSTLQLALITNITAWSMLRLVLRSHLPLRDKVVLCKGYIRSQLTYAAPAWAPMNSSGTLHRCTRGRRAASQENSLRRSPQPGSKAWSAEMTRDGTPRYGPRKEATTTWIRRGRIPDEKTPGHETIVDVSFETFIGGSLREPAVILAYELLEENARAGARCGAI